MVELSNGTPGTVTPTDDRRAPPPEERRSEVRAAEEKSAAGDSLSGARERRVEARREDIETREIEHDREAEARPAPPRPIEVAVKLDERRLERLSEISELRNASSGIGKVASAVEVARGANDSVDRRLSELARLADAATREEGVDDDAREAIAGKAKEVTGRIDRVAENTRFDDRALVDDSDNGSGFGTLTAESLGVSDLDFASTEGAEEAKEKIGAAKETIENNRSGLRDTSAALREVADKISENAGALVGGGRSGDAELLALEADRLAQQIRSQPGIAALATGNAAPVGVLSVLIGG